MPKKKILLFSAILLALLIAGAAFYIYRTVFSRNTGFQGEIEVIFLPTASTFSAMMDTLTAHSVIADVESFGTTATMMRFSADKVRPGRYVFRQGMTNREIVGKLRSGSQDAQRVVITNIRQISDLAGRAARYFESDSMAFLNYLTDPATAQKYGLRPEQFLTLFLPNTYEMFWTTTPEKFTKRMKKEYDAFWTPEKVAAAATNQLTPADAYTLASIVEKESNYDPERPTIAGVYLNRLRNGDKLQADPTVVFAVGDFTIKRVLYEHLKTESPYNTYLYTGLPPGPICMPSVASLNAVIKPEKHEYYFFCAKADNSGIHVFAKDYADHLKNADAFAAWLNSRNIR